MRMQKNRGFSLMEVLIAMIVIAVGLLGYLSLQLVSINSNQEGLARSQANFIAQDLAASIRANRSYINTGIYAATPVNAGNTYVGAYNSCTADPARACDNTGVCTDEQQATYDVWLTCRTISGFNPASTATSDDLLPGGQLFVSCDDRDEGVDADTCSPGSTLTIYTYWLAGALRQDAGQNQTVIRNSRCNATNFASDPGAEYDCLVMDIMP